MMDIAKFFGRKKEGVEQQYLKGSLKKQREENR